MKNIWSYVFGAILVCSIFIIGYIAVNEYNDKTQVYNSVTEQIDSLATATLSDSVLVMTRDGVTHRIPYEITYNISQNTQTNVINDTVPVTIAYRIGFAGGIRSRQVPREITVNTYNEDLIKTYIYSSFRLVTNKYLEQDLRNDFDSYVNEIISSVQNDVNGIIQFTITNNI